MYSFVACSPENAPGDASSYMNLGSPDAAIENHNENNVYYLDGVITDAVAEEILRARDKIQKLVVNSPGGLIAAAHKIGEVVDEEDWVVEVLGLCVSACAEYILASRDKVAVSDNAIIGVHGNSLVRQILYERNGIEIPQHCNWAPRDWLLGIYERRNISLNYPIEQIDRLGVETFQVTYSKTGCARGGASFSKKVWFMSKNEIDEFLNIKIDGALCVDNQSCREKLQATRFMGVEDALCVYGNETAPC